MDEGGEAGSAEDSLAIGGFDDGFAPAEEDFTPEGDAEAGDGGFALQSSGSDEPIVDWTTSGTCQWMIDANGCLTIKPANDISGELEDWGWQRASWLAKASFIRSAKVESGVSVSNAAQMFWCCRNLESVDLSGLDTSKCSSMTSMFAGCTSLKTLDLSYLNTSQVQTMASMFSNCVSLENLNISGFDTRSATWMKDMFDGCSSLRSVTFGEGFSFKGSGSELLCSMAIPWEDGVTGLWKNVAGDSFAPSEVPDGAGAYTAMFPNSVDGWKVVGDCAWKVDDQGCLIIKPANGVSGTLEDFAATIKAESSARLKTPWEDLSGEITSVRFESGVVAGSDLGDVFWQLYNLESVDLSNFDMSGVERMRYAFYNCYSLKKIDGLSSQNEMVLEDTSGMFSNCSSLEALDMSRLNLKSLRYLSSMFDGCTSLASLDLSGLDTRNATWMDGMFDGCSSLRSVTFGENFSFSGAGSERLCSLPTPWEDGVTGLWRNTAGDTFAPSAVPDGAGMYTVTFPEPIDGWKAVGDCVWKVDDQGCLVIKPANGVSGTLENFAVATDASWSRWNRYPAWYSSHESITSARFEPGVKASDLDYLFAHCDNLVTADLSNLDTSDVTSLTHTFYGCESLENVTGLGSPESKIKPENMHEMCWNCQALKSFDFSGIDGSNLTEANFLFSMCSSLESVNLSGFSAPNMTWFAGLFLGCSSLTEIDLSCFDVSEVSDFDRAFKNCSSLTSLDLTHFDTRNATDMSNMFDGCTSLGNVTLGESFSFSGAGAERLCSLPTPVGEPRTGMWVDVATGQVYSGDEIPNNAAATYCAQKKLSESDFAVDVSDASYSGEAVVGRVSSDSLEEGTDYEVVYSDNVNAGTAGISIVGKGLYAGKFDYTFSINPAEITADMISNIPSKIGETGSQIKLEPTVTFNGKALVEGVDYTVSYGENVNPGKGSVAVAAVEGGNFTGSATVEFDIEARSESDAIDIGNGKYSYVITSGWYHSGAEAYTGEPIAPTFAVCTWRSGDEQLRENVDYVFRGWRDANHIDLDGAPTDIGTYYVVFDGIGDYTGTLECALKIVDPVDIGSGLYWAWESGDDGNGDDVLWTGGAVEPAMSVMRDDTGEELEEGVDFEIKGYLDSEGNELEGVPSAVGRYTVILAGKGSYSGKLERGIWVRPQNSLHFAKFSFYQKTFAYTGSPIDLGLVVTAYDGTVLEEGVNYRIKYSQLHDWQNVQLDAPFAVGDYTATVEAVDGGGYLDSVSGIHFSIRDVIDIGNAGLAVKPVTYTGFDGLSLDVRESGNRLREGADFEVKSYLDADGKVLDAVPTSVGTYSVILEGKGLYKGEASLSFEIVPAEITACKISGVPEAMAYSGTQLTPEPRLEYGAPPEKGVDYDVIYGANVDVGQGTLRIVGKGNFTGERELYFRIDPKQIDAPEVAAGLVYSGEEQVGIAVSGDYEVSGGSATNAGGYTATVSLKDKKNCVWASTGNSDDLTVMWSIAKADPPHKITGTISAKKGQTLGDLELPNGFTWQDELSTSVGDVGEHTFNAKFTPKDRVNYNVAENIPVRVNVSECADGWTIVGDCAWKVDDQGCLVVKPADGVSGTLENCAIDVEDNPYDLYPVWFGSRSAITSARFEPGVKASADSLDFLFAHCGNLREVDLSNLDTTEATSLKHTFYRCESLSSIVGLGSFESKIKPQNMHEMCAGCESLESFVFSGIDGSNLTEANNLFSGCISLKSIDFGDFNAPGMTEFGGVFANCVSLTAIDLSHFNVANASYFCGAFQNCSSLKSLDFSKFDTRRAWVMSNMLEGCSSLESVTLGENFTFDGSGTEWICSLPTPSGELHTGKWVDVETGEVYSAADVPDGKVVTYRAQRRLLESDFSVDVSSAVYSGEAVVGRVSSDALEEGVDYGVAYSDNVDAGTASISIAGKGFYTGNLSYTFEIDLAAITAEMVSGIPSKVEATGSQIAPVPTVVFNGKALEKGKDYTVSYGENVSPGKGSVTVSAVEGGNFTGSATVEFDIEKKAEPVNPDLGSGGGTDPDPGTGGGGTDPAPTPDPGTGGGSGGGGGAPAPAPEPQQFSVTYHLDGGVNAASNPATFTAGTAVALAAPTREGYEFLGWYADATLTARVTEIPADASGDVELWAKWAKKAAPAPTFPDVDYSESSWYGAAVTYVAERGLITGYDSGDKAGLFGVGDTLTRAQLATILWRSACPDEAASYDPAAAKDATGIAGSADGQYYTAAANWAVKNGVVTGYVREDGTKDFAANDDVSFEQLVTILARLCATDGELASAGDDLSAFADGGDASAWSRAAFAWAAKKGLVQGYDTPSGKMLSPGEDVARERVAVVLMRAFELGLLK